jgi:hypothetical protein
MDWTRYIDIYCERLAPGFWAEPLNAVSNGAFLIAAAVAFAQAQRDDEASHDVPLLLLTALLAVIGLGSFAFHTVAQYWSLLADVIPISTFMFAYLGFALRRYFGLGWVATVVGVAAFMTVSLGLDHVLPGDLLYGSATYLPAVVVLLAIGIMLVMRSHPAGRLVLAAGVLLVASLTFRTLDLPLCERWPTGTHFMWHILNATLLYLLLRAAMLHGRRG